MPRRNRYKAVPENHERWLISYADFVTLLFAFFVVMFATSRVDAERMKQISEMYSAVLSQDEKLLQQLAKKLAQAPAPEKAAGDDPRRVLTMAEMLPVKKRVEQELTGLIDAEKISVELAPRGLIISLKEAGFFPPGQAALLPDAVELLAEVGKVVAELPNQPVRLEGHTDDSPINTPRFPSNWELSTARAIALLDLFVERYAIDPRRVSVAGYGDRHPIADNSTPEGRSKNRRVDIAILSQAAADMAPKRPLEMQPAGAFH